MALIRKTKDFAYNITILAGGEQYYNFINDIATDDYAPFKNIQIINNGTEDLKVYFNNSDGYKYIPAGTIYEREDQSISYLKIVNTSGINPVTFEMTLDNELSQKELIKALVLGVGELNRK